MLYMQGLGQERLMVRNCNIYRDRSFSIPLPNFFEDLGVNDISQVLELNVDKYEGSHFILSEHLLHFLETNDHLYSVFALNPFNISSVYFHGSILKNKFINLLSENGTCERLTEIRVSGDSPKMSNLLDLVNQ